MKSGDYSQQIPVPVPAHGPTPSDDTASGSTSEMTQAENSSLYMGQNSIAFTLLELSAISNAMGSSLIIKGDSKITLIMQDFWLDSVHETRVDTFWGQTPNEFPLFIQKKIDTLFKGYPKDKRITFSMFCEVRKSIIASLKEKHIDVIQDNIEKLTMSDDQQTLTVKMESSEQTIRGKKIAIINTLIKSRGNPAFLNKNKRDLPDHTELYREYPKGAYPKRIIVVGSGLSAIWIKEQFPKSKIKYIWKEGTNPSTVIDRNSNINILNEDIYYAGVIDYYSVDYLMELSDDSTLKRDFKNYADENSIIIEQAKANHIVVFSKVDDQILFDGLGYNATGYDPNVEIVEGLPQSILTNIHAPSLRLDGPKPYGPKNIPVWQTLMGNYTNQEIVLAKIFNFPLDQRIVLIPFEVLFFQPVHEEWFTEYMSNNGITVPRVFFDKLREGIIKMEDTPENPLSEIIAVFNMTESQMDTRASFSSILGHIFSNRQTFVEGIFSHAQKTALEEKSTHISSEKRKQPDDPNTEKRDESDEVIYKKTEFNQAIDMARPCP